MGERRKSRGCCGWIFVVILLALIAAALFIFFRHKFIHSDSQLPSPAPGHPGPLSKKYADALKIAVQFFDVQKSGKLDDNKIPWRGNSALEDGSSEKVDLSRGMYDAGDHVKFGLPMAFTATVLSWAILEYGDQMGSVNQLNHSMDSLKWITDYLVNAHPSDNLLYVQVGNPIEDHKCWERPEAMTENRPVIQINTTFPGTDVAAETAAAMASASLVFRKADPAYSAALLNHSKKLFLFADKYRGLYSVSLPEVQQYYNSTGYGDELLWAAAWLFHATSDSAYLTYVTGPDANRFTNWLQTSWFSWDNKNAGTQVLLSRLSFFGMKEKGIQKYKKTAEVVMCALIPDSPTATSSRTKGGMVWVSEWDSLQHGVASAFLAAVYSDYMLTSRTPHIDCSGNLFSSSDLRNFAISQADYVLGKNPMKLSYLVGYGGKFSKFVHHRGASIPKDATTGCSDGFEWLESADPNPNVAVGALVGGPFLNETYIDSRNNSMQTEPTTYNSALLVALLSALVTSSSVVTSFA